ncbi:D-alanyl-D-alanine carboxypeptidase/D-alanyl-D-alanine-endopeptidase [Streptomyces acidiscabies]|uniref:D-alanyl-D-alanine carboxypeptidase/D-alanyl-D-alanine-endopeptidase n=1 Tax=Streptomyces acidiscabies TaxID=42234 RepID=A0AAP6B528_9ACTN|nr:D-alanyl-D-alanine carboxypeptidase/D-alanyl-D-alanine-endopeptidase [Streptomyces acidiscabies]MBZ3912754.1 D-alanyl-D-alanine carboxypeptidase/D-alanyl-D-alanine-endopeptidase [Streptomyces acidiscabies]MDX2958239.1 D-alanyl-D-alanine carboxypeptidase/D-alanyl-D-alanine-endopeptidase [Streptomyces acidiscabies]MDX3018606.1 D-alanyl-D-alanine carboxypeptidase/D-alanyl-D-alanine-endopeptidase [Streptomyces acidiscabies]MDX3791091.1 D-alanyl-D-alanine carboxypeptidase/D-alanyl-D-alanine-endop
MSSTPLSGARGRHRKPREINPAVRRALLVAAVAPVAGTILAGPSAFAAEKATATKAGATELDPAEQQIADNLNTRVQDARLGTTFSGVVIDAKSDKQVWGHDAETALMPASNAKLATSTAALTVLGPSHRFTTKVVYGDGALTLVGGGDRTLTSADLQELAKTAAAGVKAAGLTSVKVHVDDSLFPEPSLATGWNDGYYPDNIAPVRALVVDGHGVMDTSLDAGQVFAKLLTEQGVTVDGDVAHATAAPTDVPVARHTSGKLSEIVKTMLKTSDNNIAETLLRMTALGAGRPATFEDGTAVVRDVLGYRYGVSLENFEIHDGSGLSRADRIPAQTLADILDLTTDPRYSHTLKYIKDGLPVAGEAGATLGPEWGRFDTPDSSCAVGKVMAKTGTLTGAIALSGFTQAQDGRWKVFSFVENNSTAAPGDIKDAMDGLAATVNGCWA